ncbi:MAG: PLD nuclease N-terminal domain-containing protein [Pseudomonas sp.]
MDLNFGGGLLGLIIFGLVIWAIINIAQSGASSGAKALWILLVLILPVIGLIVWFVAGPKSGRG